MSKILKIFFIITFLLVGIKSASATTLSPIIIDAKIYPGESAVYEIKLYNETENDLYLQGSIEKFTPKGDNGEVNILPPVVSDVSVTWVKLPSNSIVLEPGDAISIPVAIEVPKTADVGGYYLVVMWESSSGPETGSTQAQIVSRVGTLVLLDVLGEVESELEIVDFDFKNLSTFYSSLPVNFSTRLRNGGNVHQQPGGSVIIKDFLGRTIATPSFNSNKNFILPNTVRVFYSNWGDNDGSGVFSFFKKQFTNFAIGRFSAKAIIDYNNGEDLMSEEIYFWVFPWKNIIVIINFYFYFL
jgi:hypothetical protein